PACSLCATMCATSPIRLTGSTPPPRSTSGLLHVSIEQRPPARTHTIRFETSVTGMPRLDSANSRQRKIIVADWLDLLFAVIPPKLKVKRQNAAQTASKTPLRTRKKLRQKLR